MESTQRSLTDSLAVQVLILGTVFVLFTALMATYWPLGADYYYVYRPTAEAWLKGDTLLYEGEYASGYYNMPWMVVILAPLALFPVRLGQAVMNMGSIAFIFTAIEIVRRVRPTPSWIVLLAVANMHVLNLLIRGQIDSLLLLCVTAGWWAIQARQPWVLGAALSVMGAKPPNVALTGILFLIAIWRWPRRDQLRALALPALVLITSPLIAGLDWPVRYVEFVRDYPVPHQRSITIWQIASDNGIPAWPFVFPAALAVLVFLREAWRQGPTLWVFCLGLSTNLLIAEYATGHHYLLLIPVLLLVGAHNRWAALVIYLTTFTPALRVIDPTIVQWDYLYPVLLYAALWWIAPRERAAAESGEGAPKSAESAEDAPAPA